MRTTTHTPSGPAASPVTGSSALPDEAQLRRMGHADGQAWATRRIPADQMPANALWILDVGAATAEALCPRYGSAQRETTPSVARAAAATAVAAAARVEAAARARTVQSDLDLIEDEGPAAGQRFPFLARLPWLPYTAFLAGLGIAETVFNIGAFQLTGEDPWRVAIMAALVGLSAAMSGHLIGSSIQEVATHASSDTNDRTWTSGTLVRVAMSAVLALFMLGGMVAVSDLRADYFSYATAQQADPGQILISGLPPSADTTDPGSASSDATGSAAGSDALPTINGLALLVLNLMIWVVAIVAAYHHASIHRYARGQLRREHRTAQGALEASREKEARAIAEMVASLAGAIERIGNALSESHQQVLLTNAAVKCYLAAYLAVLDHAGIAHFSNEDAPALPPPTWASDAEHQLKLFRELHDARLGELAATAGYTATASAPSLRAPTTGGSTDPMAPTTADRRRRPAATRALPAIGIGRSEVPTEIGRGVVRQK